LYHFDFGRFGISFRSKSSFSNFLSKAFKTLDYNIETSKLL
jgi:hypothetical protein